MGVVTEYILDYFAGSRNKIGTSGAVAVHPDDPQEVAQALKQMQTTSAQKLVTLYESLVLKSQNQTVSPGDRRKARVQALIVLPFKEMALVGNGFSNISRGRR